MKEIIVFEDGDLWEKFYRKDEEFKIRIEMDHDDTYYADVLEYTVKGPGAVTISIHTLDSPFEAKDE